MKRIIILSLLIASSLTTLACHIDPLGKCEDKSYFITRGFKSNSIYHFIANGDTIETFTTGTIVTDSIFSLNVGGYTEITMAYNYIGSDFIEYSTAISSPQPYAGCGALAVHFTKVKAIRESDGIKVLFTNEDESGVLRYDISMSKDGINFDKLQSVPVTGKHNYSVKLGITIAFFLPFLVFFKSKKIRPLLFLLSLMIVIFSCRKIVEHKNFKDYKVVKVDAINIDGSIISSEIKSF